MTDTAMPEAATRTRSWWQRFGADPLFWLGTYMLVTLFVVGVPGNFPLNDDWVYGGGVKALLDSGQFALPTSCSTCFLQVGLGAVLCKITGFSFTTLRALTCFVWIASTVGVFFACREIGLARRNAALIATCYAANPIIVNLAFSFMTDLYLHAATAWYWFFLARALKKPSPWRFWRAAGALVLAMAFKQSAVVIVAVNALILFMMWLKRKHSWSVLIGLVIVPVLLFIALDKFLVASDRVSDAYVWFKHKHWEHLLLILKRPMEGLYQPMLKLGQVCCYLGLVTAPLLIPFGRLHLSLFFSRSRFVPALVAASAGTIAAAMTGLLSTGRLMPFSASIFRFPLVGVPNLLGIHMDLPKRAHLQWLTWFSGILAFFFLNTVTAGAGIAACLAGRTLGFLRRDRAVIAREALAARAGAETSPLTGSFARAAIAAGIFAWLFVSLAVVSWDALVLDLDRHHMLALMPALIAIGLTARWFGVRLSSWPAWVAVTVMGLYALAGAQDYMAWNRARWDAISALESRGVTIEQIDGGAEHAFFHDPNLWVRTFKGQGYKDNPRNNWRWWRVHDDQYIISFSPVPGYEQVDVRKTFSLLTMRWHEVYVLKRI